MECAARPTRADRDVHRYPATNFRHNSARKATGSSVGFTGFSSLKCAESTGDKEWYECTQPLWQRPMSRTGVRGVNLEPL